MRIFSSPIFIRLWDDFNRLKIVFSRISGDEPSFALDYSKMMTNDTGYIISGNDLEYLLAQLTSPLIWFAFKSFYMGGGIEKEFKVNNLMNLPVPLPGEKIELTNCEETYIRDLM
ncbi:TaqI-like C-terminal specificity domain-containing protein [Ligilactobacillus agilis]|uniref:TaqI-like C-terminal specificity domain-containing protein n=1 Tax=Ligilactobacillus agilis TaxID=1601 RepID=UPI0035314D6A